MARINSTELLIEFGSSWLYLQKDGACNSYPIKLRRCQFGTMHSCLEEHAAEQNNNIYVLLQGAELEPDIMVLPQQQTTSNLILSTIIQLPFF
jgi:hypothetical protein